MTDIPASDTAYHRPVVNSDDFRLVDEFCNEFDTEAAEVFFRCSLCGILVQAYAGNPEALAAWKKIVAELRRPILTTARVRRVDEVGTDFWQNHSQGAQFRNYRQQKGL
jgi:hypothetical protein